MIPFYYSTHHRNFGDALNPYLMERILNIPVKKVEFPQASAIGVGSLLQKCITHKYDVFRRISGCFQAELQVLSSGFIRSVPENMVLARKLNVKAVRGEESRKIIARLTGAPCPAAVGDGGLLYTLLLDKLPAKKYTAGIIPHYRDQDHSAVRELANSYDNAVIIDVLDEPLEVLKKIAECEFIISSSLHGLIVSDAFSIPNRQICFSGNITGGDFKYRDYYSVFAGAHRQPVLTPEIALNTPLPELFADYLPQTSRITELQKQLLDAMKN